MFFCIKIDLFLVSNIQQDQNYYCPWKYYTTVLTEQQCLDFSFDSVYNNETGICFVYDEWAANLPGLQTFYASYFYTGNVWTEEECNELFECYDHISGISYSSSICENGDVVTGYCNLPTGKCKGTPDIGVCTYPSNG